MKPFYVYQLTNKTVLQYLQNYGIIMKNKLVLWSVFMDFSKTFLGIEFGSTRIKAVLCDNEAKVLAQGSYSWENSFVNGHWTYPEELFTKGLADCYESLIKDIKEKFIKEQQDIKNKLNNMQNKTNEQNNNITNANQLDNQEQ